MTNHNKTQLTHRGRVTHICVSKLTIIGSDNGLSPGRRQAIIGTNAGVLLIRPLGTNFSAILIRIQPFSIRKMHLKMSSAKWCPICLGPNVLSANNVQMFGIYGIFESNGIFDIITVWFLWYSFIYALHYSKITRMPWRLISSANFVCLFVCFVLFYRQLVHVNNN